MDRMTDSEIRKMARTHYDATVLRMIRCVERYFQASGQTEFPTVRKVAQALRLQQSDVWEITEAEDDFMLTYFNVEQEAPIGDWFVETI